MSSDKMSSDKIKSLDTNGGFYLVTNKATLGDRFHQARRLHLLVYFVRKKINAVISYYLRHRSAGHRHRNNYLTEQVDILQRKFVDLSNHLTGEFQLLQESVRTEIQGIKLGSNCSRLPRERTQASGLPNAEQNHTAATRSEHAAAAIIESRDRELAQLNEYKELTGKFEAAEQHVEALTAKNKASDLSCDESARQEKKLRSQIQRLESQNEAILARLKSANDEKQWLQGQAEVLRGLITKNRGLNGTQVDDNTIATSFIKLRDQIQGIAIKLCSGKSDKDVLQDELSPLQRIYFAYWQGGSSQSQLRHRTRAVIFDIIYKMILQHKCFGLENLGGNLEAERGLRNIESAMNKMSQGHEDDVAEWRTQTMRCASFLQLESTMPGQTVGAFRQFFAPLWPQPPAEDKLHGLVTQLCKDAFSLAILLRSCKDVYRCEFPLDRSRLTEDISDGLTDQNIAYTLSGMLAKYPEQDEKRRLVLVKAHVIVY